MLKKFFSAFSVIVIVGFIFLQDGASLYAAKSVADIQAEVDKLTAENDAAESKADDINSQLTVTESNIKKIQQELTDTQSEIDAKNTEISAITQQVADTQAKISDLEIKIPIAKQKCDTILVGFQKVQHTDIVMSLLTSAITKSPSDALQTFSGMNTLTLAAVDDIKELIGLENELETKKSDLDQQKAQLSLEQEQLRSQQIDLQAKQDALQSYYVQQESDQQTAEGVAQEKAQMLKAQEDLLQFYKDQGCSGDDVYGVDCGTSGGIVPASGFIRPIQNGYVTCGYECYTDHTGIDLGSHNYHEPIYPVAPGRVVSVQPTSVSGGFGNLVVVLHTTSSGNVFTFYAHMSNIYVSQGQSVDYGTELGTMGSTGESTGPHLHLEVVPDANNNGFPDRYPKPGETVDPTTWINFPAINVPWSSRT